MKIIKIAHLYYDLMNLYGERGNILALTTALNRQGAKVMVDNLTKSSKIDFNKYDFIYIGCGTSKSLEIAREDILRYKTEIKKIAKKKYIIATGNAYTLFGKTIDSKEALGIYDFESKTVRNRIVGEQVYKTYLIDKRIIAFQNRSIITNIKENHLFEVISGNADNQHSKYEGYHINNFYGTSSIGPLLIRNPYLLDSIIKSFFEENKYPYKEILDTPEYKAYNEYLHNFKIN
jgi:CobQ-like glutamine amidotransferase family enzyme